MGKKCIFAYRAKEREGKVVVSRMNAAAAATTMRDSYPHSDTERKL